MTLRTLGLALTGLTTMISLGAAASAPAPMPMPMPMQQYYPGPGVYCESQQCYPIAYSHEVFSDAEHTNLIGSGSDTCVESGAMIYVTSPQLPSGYQVSTRMYVCSGMGPYLPFDW